MCGRTRTRSKYARTHARTHVSTHVCGTQTRTQTRTQARTQPRTQPRTLAWWPASHVRVENDGSVTRSPSPQLRRPQLGASIRSSDSRSVSAAQQLPSAGELDTFGVRALCHGGALRQPRCCATCTAAAAPLRTAACVRLVCALLSWRASSAESFRGLVAEHRTQADASHRTQARVGSERFGHGTVPWVGGSKG